MSVRNFNTLEAVRLLESLFRSKHYEDRFTRIYQVTLSKWNEEWRLHLNNEEQPSFARFLQQHPIPESEAPMHNEPGGMDENRRNWYILNRMRAERKRVSERDTCSPEVERLCKRIEDAGPHNTIFA